MDIFKGFTIYNNPPDHPDKFVVRGWSIHAGEVVHDKEITAVAHTLEEARSAVPPQQDHRIIRDFTDSPMIVESWI